MSVLADATIGEILADTANLSIPFAIAASPSTFVKLKVPINSTDTLSIPATSPTSLSKGVDVIIDSVA